MKDFRQHADDEARTITVIPMSSGSLPHEWFSVPWHVPIRRKVQRLLGRKPITYRKVETVNLARPHRYIRHVIDTLLATLAKPYLAVVIRSSTPGRPERRAELEMNMRYLMNLCLKRNFVFVTPAEAIGILT